LNKDYGGFVQRELWRRLEFRHLAALNAVIEEGSFAAAAQRLGYTQSAVSQQIAMLEEILGTQVVSRGNGRRRAELTPAGRTLAEHAKAIVARLQAAQADLSAGVSRAQTPLRIGSYESVAMTILPGLLQRFRQRFPDVPVRVEQRARDRDLLALLVDGAIDFVFATLPADADQFETRELLRDPFVLLVPAGSPLTRRSPVTGVAELAGEVLVPGPMFGEGVRGHVGVERVDEDAERQLPLELRRCARENDVPPAVGPRA
jgi:molybdate transport repressor ModE-like protein